MSRSFLGLTGTHCGVGSKVLAKCFADLAQVFGEIGMCFADLAQVFGEIGKCFADLAQVFGEIGKCFLVSVWECFS